jgi:uncharacterized protein YkwD
MKINDRALKTGCAMVLAGLALSACGEDGSDSPSVATEGKIGDASRATNHRPDQIGEGVTQRPDGIVQGEPSLEDLDRSAPPPGALGARGTSCSGGAVKPSSGNLVSLGRTTVCLINAERRSRGLARLRSNRRLARAALAHSRDMVKRSYFAHNSLSGASFIDRIKRRRYMSGRARWTVGENLAWGSGSRATPREIVDAWMRSPGHRANVLARQFRDIGIGVALGSPRSSGSSAAATFNTDFGARTG